MTDPIHVWSGASHHGAFQCGGWACLRLINGQVTGFAGGERRTTPGRMALAGLAAALRELPAVGNPGAGEVVIETDSPELITVAGLLTGSRRAGGEGPSESPEADLDLWARILVGAKGRRLRFVRAPLTPETPTAFVAAWAEVAMNKAKSSGPFSAAIPRPNLAKVAGLPRAGGALNS